MAVKDLLFEIGTEEIPARFMPKALADMNDAALNEFNAAHINHGAVRVECTPRRLVIYINDVETVQQDSVEKFRGPAAKTAYDGAGNPTKAAIGFAKGKGVEVSELKTENVNGIDYVVAVKSTKGKETAEVLPEILQSIINGLSFPKNMYWADPTVRFARPVRWIVALFGDEIVPVKFGKVTSGNVSRGHRFMGSDKVEIATAADYEQAMADNSVITDPEKRKEMILCGIREIEEELDAKVDVDPELLEEVVYINEYPVPFYGSFDERFLDIPDEVLVLTMAKNQRYFPIKDKETGKLRAYFIGVSNNIAKNMQVVREGNERVLCARLYDAAFFWEEDLKKSIDAMADELKNITYQVKLGSVYEKVSRVRELALKLADMLGCGAEKEFVSRAAQLAKFDVVSSMVYEFADVQGVMAREYAAKAGEDKKVSDALYEQYLPRFAGDDIPTGIVGAILGLAERADTIAAIFKIGLEPTSSQDPYGLRRAARCINEIIWGLNLDLDLYQLIACAAQPLELSDETLKKIYAFLDQRLQIQLKEKGFNHEAVMLALQAVPSRPLQAYKMAETLQKVANEEWFGELILAAVRVKNLLSKAGIDTVSDTVDESKLLVQAEKDFAETLENLTEPAENAVAACDWQELVSILAKLAPVIAKFFEDVLVMDKDESIKNNRLALLKKSQNFFMEIGDFSILK